MDKKSNKKPRKSPVVSPYPLPARIAEKLELNWPISGGIAVQSNNLEVRRLLSLVTELAELTLLRIEEKTGKISVDLYGSGRSGFFDYNSSDLDISVRAEGPWHQLGPKEQLKFSKRFLEGFKKTVLEFCPPTDQTKIKLVLYARVPVFFFYDLWTGRPSGGFTEVNVIFGPEGGIHNSCLLHEYAKFDQCLYLVGQCVKKWAKSCEIVNCDENDFSCLPAYSWLLLVIFYFQAKQRTVPSLQYLALNNSSIGSQKQPMWGSETTLDTRFVTAESAKSLWTGPVSKNPNECLRGFYQFYDSEFKFASMTVDIRNPEKGLANKTMHDNGGRFLALLDPFEDRNLARGLSRKSWKRIKDAIAYAAAY